MRQICHLKMLPEELQFVAKGEYYLYQVRQKLQLPHSPSCICPNDALYRILHNPQTQNLKLLPLAAGLELVVSCLEGYYNVISENSGTS